MNLYKLSQTENDDYDTFDSCIVAAESGDAAKSIHPASKWSQASHWDDSFPCWATSPDRVTVELIGKAADHIQPGVVLASFNAG